MTHGLNGTKSSASPYLVSDNQVEVEVVSAATPLSDVVNSGPYGEVDTNQIQHKKLTAQNSDTSPSTSFHVEPSIKRWPILALFCLYSASNAFQWIQYAIIPEALTSYYGVGYNAINWTSVIYMVTYIPFIMPASLVLDKYGLRFAIVLGASGNAMGACIKCLSLGQDLFWVTMVGQTIAAISQLFILNIPPRLAAVWFPDSEVSRATGIGVFGNQLGIALGFVIPPNIVPLWKATQDGNTLCAIEAGLRIVYIASALLCTAILLLIVMCFDDQPRHPPSYAQAMQQFESSKSTNECQPKEMLQSYATTRTELSKDVQHDINFVPEVSANDKSGSEFITSLRSLLSDKGFILLFLTYGLNTGAFYALSTILSQLVLSVYPTLTAEVGWMGLIIVVAGMFGSVLCGYILDATHLFKEITLFIYVFSLLGMVAFTFSLLPSLGFPSWTLYFFCALLGFFMTGYLPIGFEYACEITYPEPEGTTAGLLNASANLLAIILTFAGTALIETFSSPLGSNILYVAVLLLGVGLTAMVSSPLRRQIATTSRQISQMTNTTETA